jgi:hypothetical protein
MCHNNEIWIDFGIMENAIIIIRSFVCWNFYERIKLIKGKVDENALKRIVKFLGFYLIFWGDLYGVPGVSINCFLNIFNVPGASFLRKILFTKHTGKILIFCKSTRRLHLYIEKFSTMRKNVIFFGWSKTLEYIIHDDF